MKKMFFLKKCIISISLFIPTLLSFQSAAQIDKARVMAAYVNNCARYTTWPNENETDSFKIIVFSGNINIINEFKEFSTKRKIKEKPVKLSAFKKYPFPIDDNTQIILLSNDKSDYLLEIYNEIEGKPVLLFTEEHKDKRNIMVNFYQTPDNQLLFEVNKINIINQNLSIDPEILLSGGSEIDVASLYRKSQIDLKGLEKKLKHMKDSLEYFSNAMGKARIQMNKQLSEISKHKIQLDKTNSKLINQEKIIDSQNLILKHQSDSINKKDLFLRKQQSEILKQREEAIKLENILNKRQQQITRLNKEIENKNIALWNQSEKILHQKQILLLLIIIGLLSIFLFITIFIGYRGNKNKKEQLLIQKRKIEEKLVELEHLNKKLKEADQYKSIFLASMSHELRTPLNSIIGYTGILLMGMTGQLNEEQNKQLNKVKNNAKHLLNLINDILDISKIEAGKVELHNETLNIKSLITEIVDIIKPKAEEKQLKLTTSVPENIVISTDTRRVKQVVLNMVSNAVNYTDSGSIHIQVTQPLNNKLIISVKDTGIGIDEKEISRLFQPFQQIDSSLTKKNKGTGLGLYLCKKLMKLLNGDIYVKSEPGTGSEFYIEMPITN